MNESKAALALSTVALVPTIYSAALPKLSEARGDADPAGHLQAGEQYAACVSAAVVLGVAAVTRSGEVALVGLISVIGFAAAYRFAVRATP